MSLVYLAAKSTISILSFQATLCTCMYLLYIHGNRQLSFVNIIVTMSKTTYGNDVMENVDLAKDSRHSWLATCTMIITNMHVHVIMGVCSYSGVKFKRLIVHKTQGKTIPQTTPEGKLHADSVYYLYEHAYAPTCRYGNLIVRYRRHWLLSTCAYNLWQQRTMHYIVN